MIVSPTEPAKLRALGDVSMFPEEFGCDLLFAARGSWAGVQRKEFRDLIGSVEDGRLGEQVQKMMTAPLVHRMIVVEGAGTWTDDGKLVGKWGRGVARSVLRKLMWSVRDEGVWIDWSDSLDDTVELVRAFEDWCRKDGHRSLAVRPGPRSQWGKASSREWMVHFLQGLPGVGVELAGRLVDEFGNPVAWTVGRDELMRVEGIGKKKADALMEMLGRAEQFGAGL